MGRRNFPPFSNNFLEVLIIELYTLEMEKEETEVRLVLEVDKTESAIKEKVEDLSKLPMVEKPLYIRKLTEDELLEYIRSVISKQHFTKGYYCPSEGEVIETIDD